jgi:hypothetical protein
VSPCRGIGAASLSDHPWPIEGLRTPTQILGVWEIALRGLVADCPVTQTHGADTPQDAVDVVDRRHRSSRQANVQTREQGMTQRQQGRQGEANTYQQNRENEANSLQQTRVNEVNTVQNNYDNHWNTYRNDWSGYYAGAALGGFALGALVASLPAAYSTVYIGANTYYYSGGVYYAPQRSQYVVVPPPQGAVVTSIPPSCSVVMDNSGNYYNDCGGAFYKQTAGGYQLVAPPVGVYVNSLPNGAVSTKGQRDHLLHIWRRVLSAVLLRQRRDLSDCEQSKCLSSDKCLQACSQPSPASHCPGSVPASAAAGSASKLSPRTRWSWMRLVRWRVRVSMTTAWVAS